MSQEAATITGANNQKPGLSKDDVRDMFKEFIGNRNMNADQGGAQLMADNAELRGDKRILKEKVTALEAKQIPEGALVLTGEAAKLHNELVAALKTLPADKQKSEELVRMLKEHGELLGKVAVLEKTNLAVQIAEAEGWKVSPLLKLVKDMDLIMEEVEVEVDDEENEGKKKKVKENRGFIQVKDASGAVTGKTALRDELKVFLPSLVKDEGQGGSEEEQSASNESGTPFVRQSAGTGKASSTTKNLSQDFIKKRYGTPEKK